MQDILGIKKTVIEQMTNPKLKEQKKHIEDELNKSSSKISLKPSQSIYQPSSQRYRLDVQLTRLFVNVMKESPSNQQNMDYNRPWLQDQQTSLKYQGLPASYFHVQVLDTKLTVSAVMQELQVSGLKVCSINLIRDDSSFWRNQPADEQPAKPSEYRINNNFQKIPAKSAQQPRILAPFRPTAGMHYCIHTIIKFNKKEGKESKKQNSQLKKIMKYHYADKLFNSRNLYLVVDDSASQEQISHFLESRYKSSL